MKKILLILIFLISTIGISQTIEVKNNKLILKQTPNLSVVDSIVSKDANQLLRSTSFSDFKTQLGLGSFLENVVEDLTPQLGGGLDLNNFDITGTGNINNTGNITTSGTLQSLNATITNNLTLSNYTNIRDDGVSLNYLFTDASGNLQSSPITTLGLDTFTTEILSKNISWGESYINNWRDEVLDLGATYFPNSGGYEIGKLHQSGANPSFLFIPSAVQTDSLYTIKGGKNFTVDRASFATYVDEDRIIQTAGFDLPRIDYTDGDGISLTEPQSTNLALWSEDFSNASWLKSGVTVNSDVVNSPDGTQNADKIIETTGIVQYGVHYNYVLAGGNVQTFYVYAKKAERSWLRLNLIDGASNQVWFDLDNGVVGVKNTGVSSAKMIDAGNGWWKCVAYRLSSVGTKFFSISPATGDGISDQTGDGISGLYLWGAKHALDDSSYIKTEGTTVTRLKDEVADAGDVNTFNSEEGTLRVKFSALSDDLTERYMSISDGTVSNRAMIGYNTTSQTITALFDVGGVNQATLTYAVSDITNVNDCFFTYENDSFSLWINEVEVDTDISGSVPSANTFNELSFDDGGGNNLYFGRTDLIQYYKTIITP